jgi:uncharacterized protein (UPF0264 family)
MVRLLVSVRNVEEALGAADAGADFIDLKEPADGALGALDPERIAQIVGVLRVRHPAAPISATVGDLPVQQASEILQRVQRVAACGVDFVKVGLWPSASSPALVDTLLDALAACAARVVPVLVADDGVDLALVEHALARRAFPALMVDTAAKRQGSLLDRVPARRLAAFVERVRAHGVMAGLAGSLRAEDVPALTALAPDFAGFRGAVTRGERSAALDPALVHDLRRRLASSAAARARLPAAA